jgi:hypothetical protein
LHVRQPGGFKTADDIGVRSYSETDTVHYSSKADIGLGKNIDVGGHAWRDAL